MSQYSMYNAIDTKMNDHTSIPLACCFNFAFELIPDWVDQLSSMTKGICGWNAIDWLLDGNSPLRYITTIYVDRGSGHPIWISTITWEGKKWIIVRGFMLAIGSSWRRLSWNDSVLREIPNRLLLRNDRCLSSLRVWYLLPRAVR